MKKPRLAFFLPGLGVYSRGAETFVLELSKNLKGYEISFLSMGRVPGRWIKVKGFSRDNFLTSSLSTVPILKLLLKIFLLDSLNIEWLTTSISAFPKLYRGGFDLIVPEAGVWGNLACRLIRFLKGTPFVYVGQSKFGYWEYLCALQSPDVYVSFTHHNQKILQRRFRKLRSVVIPFGVDLRKFHPRIPSFSLNLPRPIYLCVGALDPVKRIHLAIQAVSRLEKGSLVVIGSGKLKARIQSLGEKMLGKRFFLTGVPYSRMPEYYASCDVFTLPSVHESFGITYLEAMACNKPVVTCRDETRQEIIGGAGILCNCEDLEDYSQALKRAAEEDFDFLPRRQAEKFDWNKVALQYDELLKATIEKRPLS